MEPANPRRYVPAPPPPTSSGEAQKRLQLRLELTKPSAFTKESESSIVDLLRKTRNPFAGTSQGEENKVVEAEALALEKTLRAFQKELVQQERQQRERQIQLDQTEASIVKRAGELSDQRRLLDKQREVFESGLRSAADGVSGSVSPESLRAMQELQAKIEEQTKALEESKQWLAEREAFLDESERTLIEKMQTQQERETELDQRQDDMERQRAKLEEALAALRAKGVQI